MSKLQPFLKAVAPAALTLLGTLAYSAVNGKFDKTSAVIAIVGFVGSAVTYFVPNAQPAAQALDNLFAAPGNFTPVSALKPEIAAVPTVPATAPPAAQVAPAPAQVPPTPPAA